MPFIGEKQLVVETIVASQIVPPVFAGPGAPATLTIVSPILNSATIGTGATLASPTLTGTPSLATGTTVTAGGGAGTGTILTTLYTKTGIQASATGNQIADLFTLPASTLAAGKYLYITAWALSAANGNTKAMNINWGGTGTLNGTVTGGTALPAAISSAANPAHFWMSGTVIRTGASTQAFVGEGQVESTVSAITTGTTSLTDTASIQINLMINDTTAATDITAHWIIQLGN